MGNFKSSHRISTSVAIFPSRFKWCEHKHGRDVWSSLLGFEFNAVSGILELRYSLLYLPVFRYACCALVYFILQLIWQSFVCLHSPSHVLRKLVVVGGSCGSVTGSESSTFPNLNKAFVVGPGYASVPYKLVCKITAGLFVDLADLLPENIRAEEIEPQAFLGGKTGGIRV